jgi:hypothetical protein
VRALGRALPAAASPERSLPACGIDRISLGQSSAGASKIPGASRIDTSKPDTRLTQLRRQFVVVDAGCLEHDKHIAASPTRHLLCDGCGALAMLSAAPMASSKISSLCLETSIPIQRSARIMGPVPVMRGLLAQPRATVQVDGSKRAGGQAGSRRQAPGTQRLPAHPIMTVLQTQGPITTGDNCSCAQVVIFLFQQQGPRRMGPGLRRDTRISFAFSRRIAPEVCLILPPSQIRGRRECRMRAAPAVSCAIVHKRLHTSIQGSGEHPTFPAQWLYGL